MLDIPGYIFFEFSIPRMGKRVDVVVGSSGIIFAIEFKIGENNYSAHAIEQVIDYALDLKNFHETSFRYPIVPILVATEAKPVETQLIAYPDQVYRPILTNSQTLSTILQNCLLAIPSSPFDPLAWEAGQYKPTPTIIEAAQALYRGHSVRDITRSEAGAINLTETSDAIDNIITQTKASRQKSICFITGVPGAGKTLAGLNIANSRLNIDEDEYAVFLSGNGPLVTVLRESLIRDDMSKGYKRKDAARKAQAFIQNIHHFRDEYIDNKSAPLEHVVIFDEAQRAWTKDMTAKFMKRKRGHLNFTMSEPEFLISVLDRHTDWSVIICLIGGGQEIHTGEAGLTEWFDALNNYFQHWRVYISQQITDSEYLMERNPADLLPKDLLTVDDRLHLAISVRSFRSENVSAFVKAVLDCDMVFAQKLYTSLSSSYPIFITRELEQAKNWIKQQARGGERYGLLASSGAARLRPEGIYVNADIEVDHWFLDSRQDIRSSFSLEGVATEFEIQGLELDWAVVAWDADLRFQDGCWKYKTFKGTKWQSVRDDIRQNYQKNAYRVLLTRARQGMIIYVPYGDEKDITRKPDFYNSTYEYLCQIGLNTI